MKHRTHFVLCRKLQYVLYSNIDVFQIGPPQTTHKLAQLMTVLLRLLPSIVLRAVISIKSYQFTLLHQIPEMSLFVCHPSSLYMLTSSMKATCKRNMVSGRLPCQHAINTRTAFFTEM